MNNLISTILAQISAYFEICKPKVILLMLITASVGMLLAQKKVPAFNIIFLANLGIALTASSAAIINHVLEYKIDAKMSRTNKRPIASGKISPSKAILFSLCLGSGGLFILCHYLNILTASLTLITMLGYGCIYTIYLKTATPQNIVIGGAFGAAPPLLGWCAISNTIDPNALLLVLIIYTWTPPHFWALALYKQDDYAKTGLPMLPITHGPQFTKLHIILYTILMIIATILPVLTKMFGILYICSIIILNSYFLYYTIKLYTTKDLKIALLLFKFSITYLFLLFTAMLCDHYLTF